MLRDARSDANDRQAPRPRHHRKHARGSLRRQARGWIHDRMTRHEALDVELVDLRDYPLPLFDRPSARARVTRRVRQRRREPVGREDRERRRVRRHRRRVQPRLHRGPQERARLDVPRVVLQADLVRRLRRRRWRARDRAAASGRDRAPDGADPPRRTPAASSVLLATMKPAEPGRSGAVRAGRGVGRRDDRAHRVVGPNAPRGSRTSGLIDRSCVLG